MYGLFPRPSTSSARFVNTFPPGFCRYLAPARRAPRGRLGEALAAGRLGLGTAPPHGLAGRLPRLGPPARPPLAAIPLAGRDRLRRCGLRIAEDAVDRSRYRFDRGHAVGRLQQPVVAVI